MTGPVSLRLHALEICPDRAEGLAVTEIMLRATAIKRTDGLTPPGMVV